MQKEKVILSVIVLCVLGMLGITIYNTLFLAPQILKAEEALQKESYRITIFPNAALTDLKIIKNNNSLLISRVYNTNQTWNTLHDFYVKEAKRNEWTLVMDGTISKPAEENKDLLVFHKNDYELTITINTTKDNHTFQVDLFWSGFKKKQPLWLSPLIFENRH